MLILAKESHFRSNKTLRIFGPYFTIVQNESHEFNRQRIKLRIDNLAEQKSYTIVKNILFYLIARLMCQSNGIRVGPLTESTRSVYLRRLERTLIENPLTNRQSPENTENKTVRHANFMPSIKYFSIAITQQFTEHTAHTYR